MGSRWLGQVPRFDVVLAAVLLVVSVMELVASDADFNELAAFVAALVISGALAGRRPWPLAMLVVVLSTSAIHKAATGRPAPALADPPYSFALAAAFLIAVYSVAAYAPRRSALVGLVLATATTLWFTLDSASSTGVNDFLAAMLFSVALPWTLGLTRSHQVRLRRARDEANQLRDSREQASRAAVEAERARLARELHDVVTHCLSVIVLQAAGERHALGGDQPQTAEVLETIERTGRSALADLRQLLGVLRAPEALPLTPQPRLSDLPGVVAEVSRAGVDTSLSIEGQELDLPAGLELSAYRVVQEALTNVVKHAEASKADVAVRYRPRELQIEVRDNGVGRRGGETGFGLVGLRERVALFGGSLECADAAGGGFRVAATFPVG